MGSLYENIMALCKERGIKGGKMCTELGISKSFMTELRKGRTKSAKIETAQKVADYFGVTVGYLLGAETEKAPTDNGERDILDEIDIGFYGDYKALTENDQETLRAMARLMRERRAAQEK